MLSAEGVEHGNLDGTARRIAEAVSFAGSARLSQLQQRTEPHGSRQVGYVITCLPPPVCGQELCKYGVDRLSGHIFARQPFPPAGRPIVEPTADNQSVVFLAREGGVADRLFERNPDVVRKQFGDAHGTWRRNFGRDRQRWGLSNRLSGRSAIRGRS